MEIVIGQFNDSYIPVVDGVANVVRNYAYYLNKKYAKTYVVTPKYPKFIDRDEFEVIRYFSLPFLLRPPYRFGIPFVDIDFMRRVNSIPFSIIHAHCPFSSGLLALSIARKRRIPIVTTFHTKYYDDFKRATGSDFLAKLGVKIILEFYNNVDEVWTVNNSSADTLRDYGYKGRIEIVRNGTEFVPPKDIKDYREKINSKYKLKDDEIVFLYVGQMVLQKNLLMLVNSLKILRDMGMKFKMFMIGTGKDENYLKDKVRAFNLEDYVIFMGMILDREFLRYFYARADLILFPSLYDTSSLVLQEASAMKLPALVIEGATTAEEIIDGYNGFLAKNDPYLYAQRIKDIISQKEYLKMIGENAFKTIYRHWEKIVDEVYLRYLDIIKRYKKKYGE